MTITRALKNLLKDFAKGINTGNAIRHGTYRPPSPPTPPPTAPPQPSPRWVSEYQFPIGSRSTASTPYGRSCGS
jgi:hypothetical protein